MATLNNNIGAGGAKPPAPVPATVKVWDPFVRLSHWLLVVLFALAYATGDEIERMHVAVGYAMATVVALRVIWGLIGPRYARFANFVRPPREVIAYLRQFARLEAPRYLGHNPAGGAMIVALLTMLAITCATGFVLTTEAWEGSKWIEELHEFLATMTLGLVVLHLFGVLAASLAHRENLLMAMITGRKREGRR